MTPDLLCLSTADWDAELWTNKQHLMSRLADGGTRVIYVDSLGLRAPSANARDVRRILHRLRAWRPAAVEVRPGVLRDSPLVLPLAAAWAQQVNRRLLLRRFAHNLRSHHLVKPVMWTYTPAAVEVYRREEYSGLVYHCVDDLAAYPGVDRTAFKRQERRLVEQADVCIASSRPLLEALQEMGARRAVYWPNPADVRSFMAAEAPAKVRADRPRIGFVGAVQEHKVDVELVAGIAALRPDWDVMLVGPVGHGLASSSIAEFPWPDNVELAGGMPREELPQVVASFDAALIPYRLNDYTRGVFPMKVFEYLAAGLGVVSTPLPSLVGEVDHVAFADTAEESVAALTRILDDVNPHRSRAQRQDYARGHSWEARTAEAIRLLTELSRGEVSAA